MARRGFYKGMTPWNKGKKDTPPRSEEVRKRISETNKARGVGKWMLGRKASEESKRKASLANTGKKRPWVKGWPKGKPHSKETREKLSGSNNPAWKGGKRIITLQIREMYEYREWRSDIYTRDGFTCQLCCVKGQTLNADHYPKTLASIIHEYSITNKDEARECSELWNINNGRTLCVPCHRETPTWGLKLNKKA